MACWKSQCFDCAWIDFFFFFRNRKTAFMSNWSITSNEMHCTHIVISWYSSSKAKDKHRCCVISSLTLPRNFHVDVHILRTLVYDRCAAKQTHTHTSTKCASCYTQSLFCIINRNGSELIEKVSKAFHFKYDEQKQNVWKNKKFRVRRRTNDIWCWEI